MALFEATARFQVFARVWVEASSEEEARSKIQQGGGFIDQMEFEKHTAELDGGIESIVNRDADEEETELDDEDD